MPSFRFLPRALALFLIGIGPAAAAGELAACAAIADDASRLACYDQLAAREQAPPAASAYPAPAMPSALLPPPPPPGPPSRLADQWELGEAYSRGVFRLRPHYRTYLLTALSSSPNEEPYLPFRDVVEGVDELSPAELAFQLSFKLKFADDPFNVPADLWFGYTQRSFWQAFSSRLSSPFRATDYRPEIMAVFPTDLKLLGLNLRFVNLGFVHESNGQGSTLSRSWNRVYAQLGFERGDFSLLLRRWNRIDEDPEDDDNPDIGAYLGKGDVEATYRWGRHEVSLLGRFNSDTGRGGAQVGWAFPLSDDVRRLKGYVQLFSGYGYSLIDYNHAQTVLGVGVTLTE